MIKTIEIAHYKSLADVKVRLSPVNVIVGPNGTGKSNLVDALRFLHDCVNEDIDTALTKRHGVDSVRQWSRTRPYNINIAVYFDSEFGAGFYKMILASAKGNYHIMEEKGEWIGTAPNMRGLTDGGRKTEKFTFIRDETGNIKIESSLGDDPNGRPTRISEDDLFLSKLNGRFPIFSFWGLRQIAAELSSFSAYSIYPNTLRQPQIVSKQTVLADDGSNLATLLKIINSNAKSKRSKEDILSSLQAVMPIVSDFLVKSAGGFYVPIIRVDEPNGESHDFNLSQISDGTLRVLGLLTAFYQPNAPSKIAVEEPEQMIHPGALPIIIEAARDFASRDGRRPTSGNQVFITTHSPTMLDLFEPKEIIWTRFRNGATECGSISPRHLDLIKKQLFSAGEILLTEGFFP